MTVQPEPDGTYRFSLAGVDAATSERFAMALDEVTGPMATPRYVVPRYVINPRAGEERRGLALLWLHGLAEADGVVYHSVRPSSARTGNARRLSWRRGTAGSPVAKDCSPRQPRVRV
jgi:hypothetical protein